MDNDQDDEVLVNLGASVEKESITTRSKYHKILRKTLELFLTVSVLSVLLSSFTRLSYLHSYTYCFSTFLFPFQTQALQRKYMFLLCNGILVFLASMSGFWGALSSSSSSSKTQEGLSEGNNAQAVMMTTEDDAEVIVLQAAAAVDPLFEEGAPAGASRVETNVGFPHSRVEAAAVASEEEEEEEEKADEEFGEDRIEDSGGLEENEEMVSRPKKVGEEGGENDEMESEDPGSINTEELNRKIEEFIRKMKEELRLGAQQHHLIAV